MASIAFQEARLPNGSTLKNRIVKAAMEENLADVKHQNQPSKALIRLYEQWGRGGAGLILSGHIMIDPKAMACPGDVVLAKETNCQTEEAWKSWIHAAQCSGAQFWLQINHAGRQMRAGSGFPAYAPSAIRVDIGRLSSFMETPLEMDEGKIVEVIERFAWTAKKAEELGASGVEIHAAHGYLISSFLSPRSNMRTDRWGGSLENRARLLIETIKAVRAAVSASFGVAIKINSSDFQRGGFGPEDLRWVVQKLNGMQLDFIELSGGNAESPAMIGTHLDEKKSASTRAREAYFLEAAEELEHIAQMPLLVTGGICKRSTMEQIVATSSSALRLAGVGSALGLMPDLPNRWAAGEDPQPRLRSSDRFLPGILKSASKVAAIEWNLHLIGRAKSPWPGVWLAFATVAQTFNENIQRYYYRKWARKLL